MQTPVLLVTYNRPKHTSRVLEAIMAAKPKELYVFQDGACGWRKGDFEKCAEVRNLVEELTDNSDARLHTFFSHENLGCGPGPMTALNWFFSENEMGIVLEDDAVPHPDFFPYAEELLVKYKNDESVCAIGSMNVDRQKWGDGSYYFSMMNRNLCAWATWRRVWERFDFRLFHVSRRELNKALDWYGCGLLEREFWCDRLDEVHKDGCGNRSWDMQFFMSIWLNHGKGIIPNVNLASNIGIGAEATHVMSAGCLIDNVPTRPIIPLAHPSSCTIQREADRQFHFRYFESNKAEWGKLMIYRYLLSKRLKRVVGHQGPWLKKTRR